jgi:16S rRNA (guanine(966)-N(2))-methyltransferase RsmD
MIHINTGFLKGMRLSVPGAARTRPTKSGIREALFNMLGHNMQGMSFCDLCAGSGAVGLEAASRGAERVVFVESEFKIAGILAENVNKAMMRLGDRCRMQVFNRNFRSFLNNSSEQFNLVYFDPPYSFYKTGNVPENVEKIIAESGIFVMEHSSNTPVNLPEIFGKMQLIKSKNYGKSILSLFQKK